ncbi:MAG: sortase [Bacilli bacterium]|nr:sortase [Bacilli bacterium]
MNEYLNQTNNQPLFGILEIPKINLKQPIYPKDDPKNQVDKNITLLEEDVTQNVPNPVIILASHSGNGPYAYFKNLTSLKEGDAIFLWLKSEQKEYRLIKKEEVMKNETLYVKTFSFSHLILITCSKTNSKIQEIYYAKYISNK